MHQQPQRPEQPQPSSPSHPPYSPLITINTHNTNQLLTAILQPQQSLYHRGQVIASSLPLPTPTPSPQNILAPYTKNTLTMNKIQNKTQTIGYVCVRRCSGGGKILYLDYQVYRQRFVVDLSKLLTLSLDPQQLQLSPHAIVPYLHTLKNPTTKSQDLSLTLQSHHGNTIIQKSLAYGQLMYLNDQKAQIVAMSETVWVKRQEGQIKVQGPGWVFVEGGGRRRGVGLGMWVRVGVLVAVLGYMGAMGLML